MIDSFSNNYSFLSNFYPCKVILDGDTYPSVEHAYQAAKTIDPAERVIIKTQQTAKEAKRAGARVTVREDWPKVKLMVMENLVRQKFTYSHMLRRWLLETEDQELVEGNWWGDTFWGVCKGEGENHLGRILMEVREGFKAK